MNVPAEAIRVPCVLCPLRDCAGLRPLDPEQIEYMQRFKQGELRVDRGTQVLVQGQRSAHVFTVLEGVLIRYRLLEDGRRQIVNFMFPGDLIGLQAALGEPLAHSVEALTAVTLCVFVRERFPELLRNHPELGYDVIWLAAKEEESLEEHLVALGQRSARERIAYLAVFLVQRAIDTGIARGDSVTLSVTQSQIADMLGLSLVHTNRTLQALRQAHLISWNLSEIQITDMAAAREFARFDHNSHGPRPYL
jgi:CRP/FNR family transcriptional regulator